jgi:methyl-accepting chemotaxis protein
MIHALDRILADIEFTLDCTIVTANAGEAGRGFAVIAAEVKQLAAQVSSATKTISTENRGMQPFSGNVVTAPRSMQTAVNGITSSISSVAAAGEQQSAAAQEVSSTTQSAAFSVSAIGKGVGIMATAMSAASKATEQMRGSVRLQKI